MEDHLFAIIRDFPATRLVEKTETHVFVLRLLLLLLLGGRGWGSVATSSRGRSSSRCSSGVRIGVGDAVLELVDGLPLVLGLDGDGDGVLVAVDQAVHNGWQSWVVGGKRDGGDGRDGRAESLEQLALLNVENRGVEGLSLVVDLSNTHTVGERRDVQHVQEGGFGGSDTATSLGDLDIGGNFNGTTSDLGGDTESLEERGLSGFHTSVSGWDVHIGGSDGTSTGRGGDTVVENLLTGSLEVAVGEDEADVALDVRQKTLVLGEVGHEGLERTADLFSGISMYPAHLASFHFLFMFHTMVFLPISTTPSPRSD